MRPINRVAHGRIGDRLSRLIVVALGASKDVVREYREMSSRQSRPLASSVDA